MDFIRNKAEKLIKARKDHKRWVEVFICLSIVLVIALEPILGLNGIAMTHKERVLDCSFAGNAAHSHNDDCYDKNGNLTCLLPEKELHEHDDLCYTWNRVLVCAQEESEEHTHNEDCYDLVRGDLICGKEEITETHIHDASCFRTVEIQDEENAEEPAASVESSAENNTEANEDNTTLPEDSQSAAEASNSAEETSPNPEENANTPEAGTLPLEENPAPELETDTSSIVESDPYADVETEQDWENIFAAWERSGDWNQDLVAAAFSQIGYRESYYNFVTDAEGIRHGYNRYGAWLGDCYANDWSTAFALFCLYYTGVPEDIFPRSADPEEWAVLLSQTEEKMYLRRGTLVQTDGGEAEFVANPGDLVFFDADGDQVIDRTGIVYFNYFDENDVLQEIDVIEGDAEDVVQIVKYAPDDARILGYGVLPENPLLEASAENDAAADENAATEDVTDPAQEEANESAALSEEEIEETEKNELRFTGDRFTVIAEYDQSAGIPDDAELVVREIHGGREYNEYLEKTEEVISADCEKTVKDAHFFDITFLADGQEMEPSGDVSIRIEYRSAEKIDEGDTVQAVHFENNTDPKVIDAEVSGDEQRVEGVSFSSDSFSVYGVVYTVDFHYEANGKTFDFSIPGGGFASLQSLFEALEIDADVSDVESVTFSNSDLVWIGNVQAETTVGALKQEKELQVEYSDKLTEDQIEEINAQTVEAGDWVLISMHPFTSEESLTVTMKNGDQFTVKVTDAQISTHVITADGVDYTITITYGPEAEIPDGAELDARELIPGSDEYEEHYKATLEMLNASSEDRDGHSGEDDAALLKARNDLAEMGLEMAEFETDSELQFVRFFDINILVNGKEIEPAGPVQVTISYDQPVEIQDSAEMEVIHFAEDGMELIKPETDGEAQKDGEISSFSFEQSSFSITGTLVKYTGDITPGHYIIVKGTSVTLPNGNKESHYYAMTSNGSAVEVTKNGDAFSNLPDDSSWNFTKQNGNYVIENDRYYSWLTLYNGVTGTWAQEIVVESAGTGNNRNTVTFKNPNGAPLRWDGNNNAFVLRNPGDNPDQFYLVRANSDIEHGTGYDLKPTGETELGDLTQWRDKISNSKIIVDKSASVVDYDNRIYGINLRALSDATIMTNKIDLELIVDTSRSMYFPANLEAISGAYFTSITGNDSHSLESVMNGLNKNKVYYFIGEGEKATVFALYYAASGTNLNDPSREQCWKYVDASYMNPPDAATMNQTDTINKLIGRKIEHLSYSICNQNRPAGGCRVFESPDGITRLAYLKEAVRIASEIVYAVDRNNRIGLVTFNKTANVYQNYTNYNNRQQLYSKIENISLAGGTRQDLGLQKGLELYNNSSPDAQKIAILITDGAPNMQYDNGNQIPSDTAWGMIEGDANNLKGPNSSKVKLYTLGLGLDFVGGNNKTHLNNLASEEDGITRHFNAENGPDIAKAIKSLIETLVYDVTLEAKVTDVLDPAFYPVDASGNPIAEGDYYDASGKKYNWSIVQNNNVDCWKITYYDQEIGRGEKNDDDTIKTPGWQKTFYVKAKEDFLGGNNINTNSNKRVNDHVEATKCVYKDKATGQIKKVDPPASLSWGQFTTPYVNVDELHLTEHSTEWTVYLGTEVTPEDQIRALWNEIKVKQVVKTGGTANNGTTITGSAQKYYAKTDAADTPAPPTASGYAELPITRYFTDADFESLLNQLKTQNLAEQTITYPGYGHNPGTITVKLEKVLDSGAQDAVGKAPGTHITDIAVSPAETYRITVTYSPQTANVAEIGHETTGSGEDQVRSLNEHKINVVKKGLVIEKIKKDSNERIINPATFKLYRPAAAGETGVNVEGLTGSFYEVATLTTSGGTASMPSTLQELRKLPEGQHYYLVETSEPTGYIKLSSPIQIDVAVTDGAQTKPYEATEGITTLINQSAPTASVMVTSEYAELGEPTADAVVIKIKNEANSVDITIHKVDDKNADLPGAVFKLMNGQEIVPVSGSGTGVVVKPKNSQQTVTIENNTFTIPAGGVTIENLQASDEVYKIVEVSPPNGYVITNNIPVTFKVEEGQITNEQHISGVTYTAETNDFIVPNIPGAALPNTGGPGTASIYMLGLLVIILSAGGLFMKKRRTAR